MSRATNTGDSSFEDYSDRSEERADQRVDNDGVIQQLNSLLRGEISAAETYRMAIDKLGDDDRARVGSVGLLREMQADHGRAAQGAGAIGFASLAEKHRISSGVWGAWAKFTQGTSNLFGDAAALKSLKRRRRARLKRISAGPRCGGI